MLSGNIMDPKYIKRFHEINESSGLNSEKFTTILEVMRWNEGIDFSKCIRDKLNGWFRMTTLNRIESSEKQDQNMSIQLPTYHYLPGV